MPRVITGRLVDGANQNLVDAKVSFKSIKPFGGSTHVAEGISTSCKTDNAGVYAITLQDGRYSVAVTPDKGKRYIVGEIEIEDGDSVDFQTLINADMTATERMAALIQSVILGLLASGQMFNSLIAVQETAPIAPHGYRFWWKSNKAQFFIWYDDGDSSQWVDCLAGQGLFAGVDIDLLSQIIVQLQGDVTALQAASHTHANSAVLGAITDAGSGQVITAAERLKLQGAEETANKGISDGYTPLDNTAKIPIEFIPDAVLTGNSYQGSWNASTNTPTLADGVGAGGDNYRVAVAGTSDLGNGPIAFLEGDHVIYNGVLDKWERIGSSSAVVSVAGKTGVITLVATDILDTLTKVMMLATERTKLAGIETGATADQVASEVPVSPAVGGGDDVQQVLETHETRIDALEVIPSHVHGTQFQKVSNAGTATTISTTPITHLNLSTPTVPAGTYKISWRYEWAQTLAGAVRFNHRVLVGGVDVVANQSQQAKDSSLTDRIPESGFAYVTIEAPASIAVEMQYWISSASQTALVANRDLEIIMVA